MPPLTDAAIRRAKPGAKPARMLDSAGLYLEVSPKGGKYWRQRRLAHVYPDAGPADARAALRPRTRDFHRPHARPLSCAGHRRPSAQCEEA